MDLGLDGDRVPQLGWRSLKRNFVLRNLWGGILRFTRNRMVLFYFSILGFIFFLGIVGPWIVPYGPAENVYHNGELYRLESPSLAHPLGTTAAGYDVLSRLVYGARPTVVTGLLGGTIIISIGATVGLTAGYVGGRVEDILMRITDVAYGIPLLPVAIVFVSLLGMGFIQSVVVIGLVLWRGSARVIRSQVLQIKERPYILTAKAEGAGNVRIIAKHILPNIMSMTMFFFALGIGRTILIQAGLAFIGVASPFVPSWGIMLRNAFDSGYLASALWWSIPPGLLISLIVLSTVMIGRAYEQSDDRDEAIGKFG